MRARHPKGSVVGIDLLPTDPIDGAILLEADFMDEFARAFFDADVLFVTDVYAAREDAVDGVTGGAVADRARQFGHRSVTYEPDQSQLPARVAGTARPGDLVITLGAGDIWRFSRALLDELHANAGEV